MGGTGFNNLDEGRCQMTSPLFFVDGWICYDLLERADIYVQCHLVVRIHSVKHGGEAGIFAECQALYICETRPQPQFMLDWNDTR